MTLIAYKDGIVCADSLCILGHMRAASPVVKLCRNANGDILSVAGYACTFVGWSKWFIDGEKESKPWSNKDSDDCDDINIFRKSGCIERYTISETPMKLYSRQHAAGYHSLLMGMMAAGLSAKDAVCLGIQMTNIADFPVICLGHEGEVEFWKSKTERMSRDEFCNLSRIPSLDDLIKGN